MTYLRPDAKSQVTIEYDDNGTPVRIDTIVVSTQHDDFIQPENDSEVAQLKADEEMLSIIRRDVIEILMPRVIASIHHDKVLALFNDKIVYHVNPTGKFVIGGPHGDTGLTGRKIIVDTYGGKGAHGGGAFSGKDPSKVDRSAAYAARHIAKNMVAAGVADEMLVQVSYAIGVARPINIFVDTYGRSHVNMTDGEIARVIDQLFDLRPKAIEERLKLRIYNRWLAQPDLDDAVKAELVSIAGDGDAVTDRFYRDLEFGTGGLRGVIGAGTNRMNLYTVRKATQGLADYLNASGLPKKVAIAHDSRHNGALFARETARVLAANGITACMYPRLEPTPALSWAVRYLGCGAGVCVTASHNPAKYNGYKVYGADGCQITLKAAEKILADIENHQRIQAT